jgi:hypothetical protein
MNTLETSIIDVRSDWIFDYDNGILTFENDPTVYGWNVANVKLKAYRYIGSTLQASAQSSEWKNFVATHNNLPISGNEIGDIRIVVDNGRGSSSIYRCVATTGSRDT